MDGTTLKLLVFSYNMFSPLSPLFPSNKLQIFALGYVIVSKHDMLCELCV